MINRGPYDDGFNFRYSNSANIPDWDAALRYGHEDRGRYPELSAMWNTPVTEEDIIAGRSHRYDFFNNILNDVRVTNLIYNATNSDLREL